ncbi:MAG: hypothetical protein OXF02_05175 [Simkaniaceae bacterium]|nr:hypothetical protein [Simkaniaceae bacterium]
MSRFGCFKSSRNDSPPRVVEEGETRRVSLEESGSERIMDVVGELLGPGRLSP